ncbi:MAG: RNA polymerase subunit sigma [Verrucomicrobiota bacterium]|nr:RNA polymerase subunit sigma [Verrucomicrobiota bacterium]
MGDVTRILKGLRAEDDPHAAEELASLVYEELRRIAACKMASEAAGHTLQPTALVHEAWLRLFPAGKARRFHSSKHFFCAAAEAMRRFLVDHARRKRAAIRGGNLQRVDGVDSPLFEIAHPAPPEEVLAVNEALKALAIRHPSAAELVNLRYFVGMDMSHAAEALDMSKRSAERLWVYARARLRQEIGNPTKN